MRHTNGGDGCDDFTELELVENGGLSGGVQTNHQNSHLLLPPELVKQLRDGQTHVCGVVWIYATMCCLVIRAQMESSRLLSDRRREC